MILADVAFTVALSARITFNVGDTVLFDVVLSDVSNGYDETAGIFTVPHNGTYDLTLRTMTVQNAEMYTNLMVNDERVCNSHGKGTNLQGQPRSRFPFLKYVAEFIEFI